MLSRRHFLMLSGAAAAAAATPALGVETVTLGGDAFGSFWRLTLPLHGDAALLGARIGAIVETVDALFSPYRADSEISRFNSAASLDWQPLSHDCRPVVAAALDIADKSGGAFDPTVGPAVARYGFGPIMGAERGHFSQLILGTGGLKKEVSGLSLDLCGIAKGHALDLIAAQLDALGVENYLLDLGGELFARGVHPAARAWQVGIESPVGQGGLRHMVALDGLAIATSGLVAQGYRLGERVFGHIIDPRTDAPVVGETASVSVLDRTAIAADAWATALMALPHEEAIGLAEATGRDALFLLRDGAGLKSITTGRFAGHLLA